MEKAFTLKRASSAGENSSPSPDGRYLLELMEIRKQCGVPVVKLLELLEEYPDLVYKREDLYHQQLVLYNEAGMPEKAAEFLKKRIFNPYEGGLFDRETSHIPQSGGTRFPRQTDGGHDGTGAGNLRSRCAD